MGDYVGIFERWPGYNEQSWPERFAELDRRHTELKTRMYRELTQPARRSTAEEQAKAINSAQMLEAEDGGYPEPVSVAGEVIVTQADRDAALALLEDDIEAAGASPFVKIAAYHFARHVARALSKPTPVESGLREALSAAREALCEYACHAGADVPCLRRAEQCRQECGKAAGDAIQSIDAALATLSEAPSQEGA